MSNSKLNESVLNAVEGFSELAHAMEELESKGSDFKPQKGETGATIAKLHPKRLPLKVVEIREDTPSTKTLRFVSRNVTEGESHQLPPFQAGQYVNLFVNIDGVESARPYAISSSPHELGYYELTIKRVDDGFVSPFLLDRIEVGAELSSSGPMGTFYHNPVHHGKELVFLAGGSGIAPAMSMIRSVLDNALPYQFHFIYASSYADDVIFSGELRSLASDYDNFSLTETITRPAEGFDGRSGRLSTELIKSVLGDVGDQMFYICGPTPFNEHCQSLLESLNVKSRRIRIEANGPPRRPDLLVGWPKNVDLEKEVTITIRGKGEFKAKAGEPLLNSLERNSRFVENACRSGECSLCRVKLLSGEVFNPPEALLRKSDQQFGWIHSCVAFPVSDIEILL